MSKYIGTPVVSLSTDTVDVTGDITTTDATPEVIIVNDTHEDTDGGREGKVTFKGQQSGGEETTLAEIQASHDGTSDDEKGDLIFKTNDGSDGASPTEAMRIDSAQNVGIGTSSPDAPLEIEGDESSTTLFSGFGGLRIHNKNGAAHGVTSEMYFTAGTSSSNRGAAIGSQFTSAASGNDLYFATNGGSVSSTNTLTERMRIDSSGNIGIGQAPSSFSGWKVLEMKGDTSGAMINFEDNSSTRVHVLASNSGSNLFRMQTLDSSAITFETNNAERMRISSAGDVLIAKTVTSSSTVGARFTSGGSLELIRDGGQLLYVNRLTNDGTLISLAQGNSTEGSIGVSGSTVSYNGGHLSRWSRLTSGNKDTSIVKGTVMTNLDKMVVWSHDAVAATYYEEGDKLPEDVSVGDEKTPAVDAYTEDNEQLNCMAISSVEGDPNVAGVFVNWDDDDNFKDMNVAMTGDMVIRIAKGTTVARGDLLMSAGDGTAKPQDDDIVRSKTIAKVTSTNVSHTYDDDSYCVPCVLMAC